MKSVLAKNLKQAIRDKDLTVAQLSRATKVPAQTLNNWLAGLEPRNINQVKRVAQYLNQSIDELAFDEPKVNYQNKLDHYSNEINAGIFEVVLRRKTLKEN